MRGFLVYSNTLFHNMEVKYSFVQTFISHTLKIWALYVIFLFLKSGRAEPQTPKILLNITKTLLLLLLHQVNNYQQGCLFFFHVINMPCGNKKSIFLHSNNVI